MKLHQVGISQLAVLSGFAIFAACAIPAQAGDVTQGFYVSTDTGVNLMSGVHTPGGTLRLQPGVRGDLDAGFGIKLADQVTLGLEGEAGFIWNQLDSVRFDGVEYQIGGNQYQIPLLGNLILNWHAGKWTTYIGAGGGVDYVSINERSVFGAPSGPADGDDWGPAVQGQAGVKYAICSNCEVGVGYKYLGAFSEKYAGSIQERASIINNHAIFLSLTFHF